MSSAIFRITKICKHCNNMFEAQKVTTNFCSHKCSQRNYKLRARLAKKGEVEKETNKGLDFKPKTNVVSLALVKEKEFLTVREICVLLNCSKQTVYRLINTGRLKATNILEKKTLIPRSYIDSMFEGSEDRQLKAFHFEIADCYNIMEVQKKYNVSYNGLNAIIRRNNIPKLKEGIYTYVPKAVIDKVFTGL